MKKLLLFLIAPLLLTLTACSSTVDKAELLEKARSGQELTQKDYSGLITILMEDCEKAMKMKEQAANSDEKPDAEEALQLLGEVSEIGTILQNATRDNQLDADNIAKMLKVKEKLEEMKK